jgi:hypothetical protein
MSERRLRTRPSVRGIIASHAGIFGIGWIGVIFFGLSGYLIMGSMPGGYRTCCPRLVVPSRRS